MLNHFTSSEDKKHRSGQTTASPEVIPAESRSHVQDGKRHKDRQGDDFLHDLQLGQAEPAIADPVGRDLDQVFKKSDPPGNSDGDQPVAGTQVL